MVVHRQPGKSCLTNPLYQNSPMTTSIWTTFSPAPALRWIRQSKSFDICVYSYRGIEHVRSRQEHVYQPSDTVLTNLAVLTKNLDDYIRYYSGSPCIALLGYSFGGLIITNWLYARMDRLLTGGIPAFKGSCLIASPIRIHPTRISYGDIQDKRAEARRMVTVLLEGYNGVGDLVTALAPMKIFRCRRDNLLGDGFYTFADLPEVSQPTGGEKVIEATHQTIFLDESWAGDLVDEFKRVCGLRPPYEFILS